MKDLLAIGRIIKDKRLSLNMRMDDLASICNISRATLWAIESGKGNCSINTFMNVINALGLKLLLSDKPIEVFEKKRATRINTSMDKKKNRFINMCIEQYAYSNNLSSRNTFTQLRDSGIIDELKNDYEDLHGESIEYMNEYIKNMLERNNGFIPRK